MNLKNKCKIGYKMMNGIFISVPLKRISDGECCEYSSARNPKILVDKVSLSKDIYLTNLSEIIDHPYDYILSRISAKNTLHARMYR